ncbi:DUF1877 family protein [Streptomyces sp. NPDC002734]|uniref:DUF1877 family protein n=1 Tax=Streptomyces sp. NPDC002734 TaxID=3154426 RepID=UPI003327A4FB
MPRGGRPVTGRGPQWDPPAADTLDLDWAIWELCRLCRHMRPGAPQLPVLLRAVQGDDDGALPFLDHDTVYDGFDGPPAHLPPEAVGEVARALAAMDIGAVLETLPAYREAGGFAGFTGDVRTYLVRHFTLLREFYRVAHERGWCVVVWVD